METLFQSGLPFERGEEERLKCVICSRETSRKDYCEQHAKAYENIVKRYEVWKEAVEISWKEYLSEIIKNSLTGEWVKEVAEYLTKSGEK